MDSIRVYLLINQELYNTDEKKIAFALSFMREGSAQTWASTFTKKALDTMTFGTFIDFIVKFKDAFVHEDVKGEAISWLTNARVSKEMSLSEYISLFQNNTEISGITNDNALINFFSRGIPTSLMKRIYSMDNVPTTIREWYDKAMHFKVQWDRAKAIKQRKPQYEYFHNNKNQQKKPQKDPNTMDVDRISIGKLTPEERQRCQEKGLCFKCRKPGHVGANCTTYPKPQESSKQTKEKQRNIASVEEKEEESEEETIGKVSAQDF